MLRELKKFIQERGILIQNFFQNKNFLNEKLTE